MARKNTEKITAELTPEKAENQTIKREKKSKKKRDEQLGTPKEDIIAFIDDLAKEKRKYANLRSLRMHLSLFLNGNHAWENFKVQELKLFQQSLQEKVKPQTAFGYLKALHLVFETAARKRYISETPFDTLPSKEIAPPATDEIERSYLHERELQRLFQAPSEIPSLLPIRQLFLFACYTGLKWNDLLMLKWVDIVKKSYQNHIIEGFMYSSSYGKISAKEFIPFLDEAIVLLNEIRTKNGNDKTEFVFDFLHEKDMEERSINRRYQRLLKKYLLAMGVKENLNFHSARHTYALLALKRGIDSYTVGKLLGYKTLAMIAVYMNLSEKEKIEAVLNTKI